MSDRYGGQASADRLLVDNHDPAINAVKVIHEVTSGVVSAAHIENSNTTASSRVLVVKGGADLISARTLADTEVFKVDQSGNVTFAGSVTSKRAAPVAFAPADPSNVTSASLVMMGLGATCVYTPASSGTVLVNVTGVFFDNTAETAGIAARYGTSTAPANAAAVTGTRFGGASDPSIGPTGASRPSGFAFTDLLTLTPATAYWFDLATKGPAGTTATRNVSMTFFEIS